MRNRVRRRFVEKRLVKMRSAGQNQRRSIDLGEVRQHDLVDLGQPTLPPFDYHWVKRAVPVARDQSVMTK